MKRIFLAAVTVLAVLSCSTDVKSVLNITAAGLSDSTQVIVYKLNLNQLKVVDTLFVKGGKACCEIASAPTTPDFYYVDVPGRSRVALVLSAGDKVDVNLDDCSVSGSEESVLFNEIEKEFASFVREINDYASKSSTGDIARSFVNFKKQSVKRVMSNPASMTNIPVLFRKVSELQVFGEVTDAYIMQAVYDTLSVLYPESPYVTSLKSEIDMRKNRNELANMLSSAKEVSFPDIVLPDITGQERRLSEVENKVVLLLFWNSQMENISVMNAEVRELYARYKDSGFEIFQVGLDSDKTSWAASVKGQDIQWISVVDTRGSQSTYISLYTVTDIPYAVVMDRQGKILSKGGVDMDNLSKVISAAVRR